MQVIEDLQSQIAHDILTGAIEHHRFAIAHQNLDQQSESVDSYEDPQPLGSLIDGRAHCDGTEARTLSQIGDELADPGQLSRLRLFRGQCQRTIDRFLDEQGPDQGESGVGKNQHHRQQNQPLVGTQVAHQPTRQLPAEGAIDHLFDVEVFGVVFFLILLCGFFGGHSRSSNSLSMVCLRHNSEYLPFFSSNSEWVPRSITLPPSRTRISSAWVTALRR